MKVGYSLTPYTKINAKWIKDMSIRLDTIKLLEESIGRTIWYKPQSIFLDQSPSVMEIKTKVNKWDLIKLLKAFAQQRKP